MRRVIPSCTIAIVLCGGAAYSHHSISGIYDNSRRETIDGVVAQFQFVNPHPFVMMDVKGARGEAQQWKLEMDNRHELSDVGMTADTLKQGDRLVVTGSLGRTQSHSMYVLKLDRPADGFQYEQVGTSPRVRGLRPSARP